MALPVKEARPLAIPDNLGVNWRLENVARLTLPCLGRRD